MKNKTPAEKAWETMRSKLPAVKARYTINRQTAAKNVAARVKAKQWEPEKVKYLTQLKGKATPNTCVVCGDSRPFVLQIHHVDPKREVEVTLCANCHDIVRRSTLENLTNAYNTRTDV
jgi:NAD-dependent SIR2 family protein deacetylase